jgi:hypothetical protein
MSAPAARFLVIPPRAVPFEVEGAEQALNAASRIVHLMDHERRRHLATLQAGRAIHYAYGFVSVAVEPVE